MKLVLLSLFLSAVAFAQVPCENTAANSSFNIQVESTSDVGNGVQVTIIASPLSCELQAIKFTVTWTQTYNTKPDLPTGCTWNASTTLTCVLTAEVGRAGTGSSTLIFTATDVVSHVQVTAAGILSLTETWAEK
jgi:hypothetical protein